MPRAAMRSLIVGMVGLLIINSLNLYVFTM